MYAVGNVICRVYSPTFHANFTGLFGALGYEYGVAFSSVEQSVECQSVAVASSG